MWHRQWGQNVLQYWPLYPVPRKLKATKGNDNPSSRSSLIKLPPLSSELVVEISKLTQEAIVGSDFPMTTNLGQGFNRRHVLTHHQVRQDAGARAGHSHQAVHQNFAWKNNTKLNLEKYLTHHFVVSEIAKPSCNSRCKEVKNLLVLFVSCTVHEDKIILFLLWLCQFFYQYGIFP